MIVLVSMLSRVAIIFKASLNKVLRPLFIHYFLVNKFLILIF